MQKFDKIKVVFFPHGLLELEGDGKKLFSCHAETIEVSEGMPWDEDITKMRAGKRSVKEEKLILERVAKAFGRDPRELELVHGDMANPKDEIPEDTTEETSESVDWNAKLP